MIRAHDAAQWLNFAVDLIALGALAGTGEVHPGVFGAVALCLGAAVYLRRKKSVVSARLLAVLIGLITLSALGLWLQLKFPLILAVANFVPLLHALLWLVSTQGRSFALRLGVGFVELNVAAALSTDLYLSIALFAYAVLASVAISCHFLDQTIREQTRPGAESDALLPPKYIRSSIGVGVVLLLSSIVIFPILPRTKSGGGIDYTRAKTGYTENVSITDLSSISGVGEGHVVLRIFYPENSPEKSGENGDVANEILLGLLRGKTLSIFDGVNWYKGIDPPTRLTSTQPARHGRRVTLEALREPLDSEVFPVPYGTRNLIEISDSPLNLMSRLQAGEWTHTNGYGARLHYQFDVQLDGQTPFGSLANDPPRPDHTAIPPSLNNERLQRLAQSIFPPQASTDEKVRRLKEYFVRQGFTGSTELPNVDAVLKAKNLVLAPVEKFLLITRTGHCELFATSAAMLLRMAGVPTRLISGFRMIRNPSSQVVTIRSGDAHAWLEYWVPGQGWRLLDPTPREMMPSSLWSSVRDLYDQVSSFWSRYLFEFDADTQFSFGQTAIETLRRQNSDLGLAGLIRRGISHLASYKDTLVWGAGLAVLLSILAFLVWHARVPGHQGAERSLEGGPRWLRRERRKMERALMRSRAAGRPLEGDLAQAYGQWLSLYEEARFGEKQHKLEQLRERSAAVTRLMVSARVAEKLDDGA